MHFTIQVGGRRRSLTPWQPGTRKPDQPGVYQRNYPAGPYSRWDGNFWCNDASSPELADREVEPSTNQRASWRGLGEPPLEGEG